MNNRYIYIYLDPRKPGIWQFKDHIFKHKPFYIGVGSNKRIVAHLNKSNLNRKAYKSSKIKSILKQKLLPIYFKIYENLNLNDAFLLEKEIISHFGRSDIKTGILCNHTDGGIGWRKTKSLRKKIYKKYYKYSLDGVFQGVFSRKEIISQNINPTNISTAIKRNGTHANFIWCYEFLGDNILPIIKHKQKYGFSMEEKLKIKDLYLKNIDILNICKELNTTKEKIITELKYQNIYIKQKLSLKIQQLSLNDCVIKIWNKAFEIEQKLGYNSGTILKCCKGKRKTYKKFKWKYNET